jgi:hypothetical protein
LWADSAPLNYVENKSTTTNTAAGYAIQLGGGNAIAGILGIAESTAQAALGLFTGGTGTVAEKIRITSGGLVGINTNTPTRLLDVDGVIRTRNSGSAGAPSIELGTSAQGNGIFYPATNTLAISTNDTERMRITSAGLVGIGTNAPFNKLTVKTGTGNNIDFFDTGSSFGSAIQVVNDINTAYKNLDIYSLKTSFLSGNVLIGTTTDAGQKLQVNGDTYIFNSSAGLVIESTTAGAASFIRIESATINDLWFGRENSTGTSFGLPSNSSTIYSEGAYPFCLFVNGSTRLQITTSGNTELSGSVKTGAPTTGTAAAWKLGSKVAAAVTLDTSNYIEVEVGGVFYKLAIVT